VNTGEKSEISLDGLFISVGRTPETALFAGKLALDEAGYILADESTQTSLTGVYAVGDVRTKAVRQIVTAAADGAVAAHYAEQYLTKELN
jgi:thioredoxin reductase (NADPH)